MKHFAVGGFFESALRSWWIFIRRDRFVIRRAGRSAIKSKVAYATRLKPILKAF